MANHSHLIPKCPVLSKDSVEYAFSCAVCYTDFDKVVTVPYFNQCCGHSICKPCCKMLRDIQELEVRCPICQYQSYSMLIWDRNHNVVTKLSDYNISKWHHEKNRFHHEHLMKQMEELLKKHEELYGTPYELKYMIKGPEQRTTQFSKKHIGYQTKNDTFIKDYQYDEICTAILNLKHDNSLLFVYNELLKKERADLYQKCYNEEYSSENDPEYLIPVP